MKKGENHPEFLPPKKKITISILVYFCFTFHALKHVKLFIKFKVIYRLFNKNLARVEKFRKERTDLSLAPKISTLNSFQFLLF